jgi:Na+-translocating ferredoxin:NAD+ oxidoreductase RnfC subunit
VPQLHEQLRTCGVVGAGGGGFPTDIKAQSKVEFMIANGAECEPLLHKDLELMVHFPGEIVGGMKLMMDAVGAPVGKFGLKTKNTPAIHAIAPQIKGTAIDMVQLGDFYPSGDEYELVYTATGRLIPPAGIPLQVGCVVSNVETLYNAFYAAQGQPVTRKFLSVTGAVKHPKSVWAPIGISFRELIAQAGGSTVDDFAIFISGMMMGTLTFDLDEVVTKTTGGLILLPRDHYSVQRRIRPLADMNRIGKSACDQCSYCTEFCPRYLLGYDVQPHKVMRSLGFTTTGADVWNQSAELCCLCGLCTLYACPEDLYPKEACDQSKKSMRAAGTKYVQTKPVMVHPMKEGRRVPLAQLRRRLKVEEYECDSHYDPTEIAPSTVRIKVQQHAGKPATPVVNVGDRVQRGTLVAQAAQGTSANIHSSIEGSVRGITEKGIEIQA